MADIKCVSCVSTTKTNGFEINLYSNMNRTLLLLSHDHKSVSYLLKTDYEVFLVNKIDTKRKLMVMKGLMQDEFQFGLY